MTASRDSSCKPTRDLHWDDPCVRDMLAASKLSFCSTPFDATGWAKVNAVTTPLPHFPWGSRWDEGRGGREEEGGKTWDYRKTKG